MTDTGARGPLPSSERWTLLEPILDGAMAREASARAAYLAGACGTDASLRDEVERLIAACERLERDADYLEQPAVVRFANLWDERLDQARFRAAIGDRYTIEDELGAGGMAVVYRARDRGGRLVALKVLRATASAGVAARFRQEIALASQLSHERIVPVLDSGNVDDRLWYTMPLVDGESLGGRLRRGGLLSIPDALCILRDIAEALAFAHSRGVVHRDLKPDNVLLADGRAMIADFGVAKAILAASVAEDGIRTSTGATVGTPAYMSPEQYAGEKSLDHRADLYALGVIAYEILTGAPPFSGSSRQALMTAHLAEIPSRASKRRKEIPAVVDTLVMRLLAKRAIDRPASAAEVVALLLPVQPRA
jgi:serine/threonine protein kinase